MKRLSNIELSMVRIEIKNSILHYLCDDWNNHKRGKAHKENQAIFDRKDGYAIWNDIDLEMVMEKVVKGIWSVDIEKILTVEYRPNDDEVVITFEFANEAIKKQIPKKVVNFEKACDTYGDCPRCGESHWFDGDDAFNYCPECGQALDWSEEE